MKNHEKSQVLSDTMRMKLFWIWGSGPPPYEVVTSWLEKNKSVTINEVPFYIEANNDETKNTLLDLAKSLSNNVNEINSEQRKKIHLAAVFACNFSNYMYSISEDILNQSNIDLDILKPLIIETAKKIQNNSPKTMQTGPAKRNDDVVLKNHIELLANSKDYQDIYKIITDNIIKRK